MELLICIQGNGNAVLPGHVIDAQPDGWQWSPAEREHPGWRIVRADITQVEADSLKVSSGSKSRVRLDDLPNVLTRADLYARASE